MRISARMTRNTSISLGPIGWLVLLPIIAAVLLAYAAVLVCVGLVQLGVALYRGIANRDRTRAVTTGHAGRFMTHPRDTR